MMYLTKKKVRVHLKSGQTIKLHVSDYEVRESGSGIVSYKFNGMTPRCSLPVEAISAITYHPEWWRAFLVWLFN